MGVHILYRRSSPRAIMMSARFDICRFPTKRLMLLTWERTHFKEPSRTLDLRDKHVPF
jgi:hypothetical protein